MKFYQQSRLLQTLFAALTIFMTMNSSPFAIASADNSETIRTTDQTIILIHGLGRTSRSMRTLERSLTAQGYTVVNLDYPSTRFDIEHLTKNYLAPAIEKAKANSTTLHFVTHSMGGILVRHYLSTHSEESVKKIVMLAPPNGGSEIIDEFGDYSLFRSALGPAAQQLSTNENSLPNRLPALSQEIGVIAGTSSLNPLSSCFINGLDDGKVSVASTMLPEMTDHLVLDVGHTFIMTDPQVLKHVSHFLSTGTFQH